MSLRHPLAAAALTLALGLAAPDARAAIIVSNLDQPTGLTGFSAGLTVAGRFTLDPGTNWLLGPVTLLLDAAGSPIDDFPVTLYEDANDLPGPLLATLGTIQTGAYSGFAPQTVDPSAQGIVLVGGLSYWVGLAVTDTGLRWANTESLQSGPSGTIDPRFVAFDPNAPGYFIGGFPLQFAVSGTPTAGAPPVPEPTGLALAGIGAAGLLASCYRVRRRRSCEAARLAG